MDWRELGLNSRRMGRIRQSKRNFAHTRLPACADSCAVGGLLAGQGRRDFCDILSPGIATVVDVAPRTRRVQGPAIKCGQLISLPRPSDEIRIGDKQARKGNGLPITGGDRIGCFGKRKGFI